jgi:UDP-N-acetyl-2-amino-2-deoxyglucuronate dehydrogenase
MTDNRKKQFALIGAAGYIASRHMKAIRDTGNELVAAMDPHDSVGVLDSCFPDTRFFTEIERFDRHLEKLRRSGSEKKVDYVSICSPNYLHDAHVRLAMRVHAHAICEKPLVINPWNLDALSELETEFDRRVYTVLQLRLHPAVAALKQRLNSASDQNRAEVDLTYITRRGSWYGVSWKGSEEKSGGVAMNIGIHFFDMLLWLFGAAEHTEVHVRRSDTLSGILELERARVRWFLSLDGSLLPEQTRKAGKAAYRALTLNGEEINFSEGFTELHTRVYEDILAGNGFGIREARPSIGLVCDIRHKDVTAPRGNQHPMLVI